MKPECIIQPQDTSEDGMPILSKARVISTIAPTIADLKVDGKITWFQLKDLQVFCYSARVAGSLDAEALEHAYDETGLSDLSLCETCEHHR